MFAELVAVVACAFLPVDEPALAGSREEMVLPPADSSYSSVQPMISAVPLVAAVLLPAVVFAVR